jgi:glutathione S-transferase
MSDLTIFSYLPNPRLWKASIVARLCGVDIDIRGDAPEHLAGWLWDAAARPLTEAEKPGLAAIARRGKVGLTATLYKTEGFLAANPFGNVPAAFAPDGTGIFESNSIMRAVARLGGERCRLYGDDPYSAARIDGFLDVTLLFAREVQLYVLALRGKQIDAGLHASTQQGFANYLSGIEQALAGGRAYLADNTLSLADIAFFAELALLHNEHHHHKLLRDQGLQPFLTAATELAYPLAFAHFVRLRHHEAFAPDVEAYLRSFPETAKTP